MINTAFGESAMSKAQVKEWYERFEQGREDVDDDERPGGGLASKNDDDSNKANDEAITDANVGDVGIFIGHENVSDVLGTKREHKKKIAAVEPECDSSPLQKSTSRRKQPMSMDEEPATKKKLGKAPKLKKPKDVKSIEPSSAEHVGILMGDEIVSDDLGTKREHKKKIAAAEPECDSSPLQKSTSRRKQPMSMDEEPATKKKLGKAPKLKKPKDVKSIEPSSAEHVGILMGDEIVSDDLGRKREHKKKIAAAEPECDSNPLQKPSSRRKPPVAMDVEPATKIKIGKAHKMEKPLPPAERGLASKGKLRRKKAMEEEINEESGLEDIEKFVKPCKVENPNDMPSIEQDPAERGLASIFKEAEPRPSAKDKLRRKRAMEEESGLEDIEEFGKAFKVENQKEMPAMEKAPAKHVCANRK